MRVARAVAGAVAEGGPLATHAACAAGCLALQQTLSRRAPDGILHTDVVRALTASRLFEGALRLM